MRDLLVTYPGGSTVEHTAIVAVTRVEDGVLFAVERTPCHPQSPRWPDQPADRCTVELAGGQTPVACFEGFLRDGRLGIGDPAAAADGGATAQPEHEQATAREAVACVVHRAELATALAPGLAVTLRVDAGYRARLSHSHSRCHLVSLALNAALAGAWRKDPGAHDSLGNPDFDKLAIQSSTIGEDRSVDVYRIGRHVRKSGFTAEALADTDALAAAVAAIARRWLAATPRATVTPAVCRLDERRTWACELPDGTARFQCGGTHSDALAADERIDVAIAWEPDERRLTMTAS